MSINRQRVIVIDHDSRHGIAGCPVCDVRRFGMVFIALGTCVKIVLAHKDHRKAPEARKIQGFVKGALVGSAIPDKTDGDPFFPPVLLGKGMADGNGRPTPTTVVVQRALTSGTAKCSVPLFLLLHPVRLPNISAISTLGSAPLASRQSTPMLPSY